MTSHLISNEIPSTGGGPSCGVIDGKREVEGGGRKETFREDTNEEVSVYYGAWDHT